MPICLDIPPWISQRNLKLSSSIQTSQPRKLLQHCNLSKQLYSAVQAGNLWVLLNPPASCSTPRTFHHQLALQSLSNPPILSTLELRLLPFLIWTTAMGSQLVLGLRHTIPKYDCRRPEYNTPKYASLAY